MSTYEVWRHFADSWGLLAMVMVFVGLCAWPMRKGAKQRNQDAAYSIFKDQDDGE